MATSLLRPIRHGHALGGLRECTLGGEQNVAGWGVEDLLSANASDLQNSSIRTGLLRHGVRSNLRRDSRSKVAQKEARGTGFRLPFAQPKKSVEKQEVVKQEPPKKLEPWPQVEQFVPPKVKFPPAFQIATFAAFTLAAYVVQHVAGEILASFLQTVESIPYLAQLESLIGVLVITKFVSNFLVADTGKVRLESLLDGIQEKVAGNDLDNKETAGPQMLEVQLRSLLSDQAAAIKGKPVEEADAVLLKQTLVTSLMSFILERETKARRINTLLRKDVDQERARVTKLKQAVALYAEKEAASLKELNRLTSSTKALRDERDAALANIASLNARLETTTGQLESMSFKRSGLESLNSELSERIATIVADNKRLSTKISSFEDMKETALFELKTAKAIADASLSTNKALQAQVHSLEKEREEVQAALGIARRSLVEAEKELTRLRVVVSEGIENKDGQLGEASSAALASMRNTLERTLRESQTEVARLEKDLETLTAEKAELASRMGNVESLERSLQVVTEEKETLAEKLAKAAFLGKSLEEVSAEKEALAEQLAKAAKADDLMVQIEELEKSLGEAEAERIAAKARIVELESHQDASRIAIDELETELEEAVQQLASEVVEHRKELAARLATYEQELESRKAQIEELTTQLTNVQKKRDEAEEGARAAQARLDQLDQSRIKEIQDLREEVASMRAAGSLAQEVIARLESQIEGAGIVPESPMQMLASAHRNREDYERQLAEAQSSMDGGGREERIAALRAEVEAWQTAEGEAEQLVNQLEDQIQSGGDVKSALATFEQALEAKHAEIANLEAQLASNEAEYSRIMEEKEGLQAELESKLQGAERERDDAMELLADGRNRLAEMKDLAGLLVSQLESRVLALTNAEEQSQGAIALLEKRLAALQTERGAYSAEEVEARLQVQEARIEELSQRLEGVKEEKDEIKRALMEAEVNLQQATEQRAMEDTEEGEETLEGVIQRTEEEKKALGLLIQSLTGAESESRNVIAQLEQRLSAMIGEVADKRKEAADAESTLEEAVETLEQELRSLVEQRAGLAETLEQTKAELAAQESTFAEELETLREKLAVWENSGLGAQDKVSQLEAAVEQAERERAALAAEATEARARAEELEREKAGLLASREAELLAARQERDAIREKFRAASLQLTAAHEGSRAQQREVARLEGRLAELTSTNEQAKATIDKLTAEKATEGRQDEEGRNAVSQQLEDSRRLKEGLDQELVALQAKLAESETAGNSSMTELQAEVEALRAQERRAQQEVEALREQLTAVTNAADERLQSVTLQYTSGLSDKENEVENLLRGLRALQQEKLGASAELEEVRRQVEQLELARERDVRALQLRVIQLEEEGHEGGAALESARSKLREMESGVARDENGAADAPAVDVERYDSMLSSLKAEKQELASSQASLQSKLAQLAQEREQQRAMVTSLELRLTNNERDHEASLALIERLRSEIQAAERAAVDAEETKSQLAELQTQLQEQAALADAPPSVGAKKNPPQKSTRKTSDASNGAVAKDGEDISPELKAHLIAYNYDVREQFVDLRKTAKQQSEGVQKLIEALIGQGATEAWARAYVIRNLSYERAKLKKQDRK